MTHTNAPLTPEGRHRLITRVLTDGRPIAHVAAEAGIARSTLSKWVTRYRAQGADGLEDRSSAPAARPKQISLEMLELIDRWRRDHKWSARRTHLELAHLGHHCCPRTVSCWLKRLCLNRRQDLDPTGENNRHVGKITARFPGHMLHLDVKKVGKIPDGAAGGLMDAAAAKRRRPSALTSSVTYLHSAVDGYSRPAYTEALEDETAQTTIGFFARARAYFAAHGITRLIRVVTDNGANYRASRFVNAVQSHALRHQRTRAYTPRHNGKVERYQRLLAEECLYARVYDSEQARRKAIGVWAITTTIIGLIPPVQISHRPAESTNV